MNWKNIVGWWDEEDRDGLSQLLYSLPTGAKTIHVGILQGRHLASVDEALSEKQIEVHAIDTWRGDEDQPILNTPNGPVVAVQNWTLAAIGFGYTAALYDFGKRLTILPTTSLNAASIFRTQKKEADLVFIDSDHRREFVRADIQAWMPIVKSGGILCGHDYNPVHADVIEAVQELCPGLWIPGGTVWAWRKP